MAVGVRFSARYRIMKSRKTMKHQQLIAETVDQLKARFQPKVPDVKKGIDAMLDREYIEREEGSRDTYRCVASGRGISPVFPSLACLILADHNSFMYCHSLSGTSHKLAPSLLLGPPCASARYHVPRSHRFSSHLVSSSFSNRKTAFADDPSVHVPRSPFPPPRRAARIIDDVCISGREPRPSPSHSHEVPPSPPLDACFRLFVPRFPPFSHLSNLVM